MHRSVLGQQIQEHMKLKKNELNRKLVNVRPQKGYFFWHTGREADFLKEIFPV